MTLTLAAGWLNRQVRGVADAEPHAFWDSLLFKTTFLCQKSFVVNQEPRQIHRENMCVEFENREKLAENSEGMT